MWIITLVIVFIYGMRTSLGQVGSPWDTGRENDYYYEQLHPDDDLPVITTENQKFAVNLGDPLVLPCPITNLGHFTLIWRRGDQILWVLQDMGEGPVVQPVSRDPRVSRDGTSLTIGEVAPDDENIYTCEVSTQPPRSVSHTLTVKVPPVVYPGNNRSTMIITQGDTAYLRCIVSGSPVPIVSWTKEGKIPIPLGQGVNLTLYNTKAEDNGVYKCSADNGATIPVHTSIDLQVMHPPEVRVEKEEVYSGVTYDAVLACYVYATPTPKVKWYRSNGEPVDPMRLTMVRDVNKRYSLQFDRVLLTDFGDYTCNASNFMGNASGVVRLTGRPKPVRYYSTARGDKDTSYTLVWEVESYSPVLTYSIAYRNETDNDEQWVNFTVPGTSPSSIYHSKSHTFTDLEPGASYHVLVSARNEFGYSDVNDTFIFTTLDPVGTDPPEDLLHEEEELIPNNDQYQDVVSEVGGVTESQAPPPSEVDVDAATAQTPNGSPANSNLTEIEEVFQRNEVPAAEKAAVSEGTSETFSLTPREKRAQMVALVTAISLSSFFL